MGKYSFTDDELGDLIVSVRRGMRHVRSKIKDGTVELSIPPGLSVAELKHIIDTNRTKLKKMLADSNSAKLRYYDGQTINCLDGYSVTIGKQSIIADKAILSNDEKNFYINIPQKISFEDDSATGFISACLKSTARRIAPLVVPGLAQKVAADVCAKPAGFVIGSGLRKLGHCTRTGVIQLSYNMVFLPEHLARFIILHEITHLTHFNHSPEFHSLLDYYCNGKEKSLHAELKQFHWPVKL